MCDSSTVGTAAAREMRLSWCGPRAVREASHPRIAIQLFEIVRPRGGGADVVQQVDEVRVVQLEPVRNRRRRAPAPLSERGEHLRPQLGIENLANPYHLSGRMLPRELPSVKRFNIFLAGFRVQSGQLTAR